VLATLCWAQSGTGKLLGRSRPRGPSLLVRQRRQQSIDYPSKRRSKSGVSSFDGSTSTASLPPCCRAMPPRRRASSHCLGCHLGWASPGRPGYATTSVH
jgi:hypothetical protein